MKYLIIFLVILFFISAIWYAPQNVQVGSGLAERMITRIESFSEAANAARYHIDYLDLLKNELEFIKSEFNSLPTSIEDSGLEGINTAIRLIGTVIIDTCALPLVTASYLIAFIIDAIIIVFKFFDFFTLFT